MEGQEDVQDNPISGQTKTQRKDANVDRVQTLVRSDRGVGVTVTAELNMNRETVQQITAQVQTVNQQCYSEVLTSLRECVQMKILWSDKWILHHDSALRVMR
jgi:hypothetical protein